MIKEGQKNYFKILTLTTLVLFIIFLIIPIVFFFLLDSKTGTDFGIKEIFFSLTISIIATLFLLWIKSLIMRNSYLGSIIGLVGLGATQYALFFKYQGQYTTIFSILTSLVVIIYLGMNFIKSIGQKKSKDNYYEDNPSK